jgi:hypothetical protein
MRRKKDKKNLSMVFVSVFIALILVTSILGYIFQDTSQTAIKYNGQKFTYTNNMWRTKYEDTTYYFTYHPSDIEHLNLSGSVNLDNLMEIDITYDDDSEDKELMGAAAFELSTILSHKNIFLRQGFTSNNTFDAPIITCADATPFVPVILLSESNVTQGTVVNNCIIIESQDQSSFMAYIDLIAYKILRIM